MPKTTEELLQEQERREARDSYRRTGGSKRRPLKSFLTEREKREAREEHAARLRTAIEQLRDEAGFHAWAESMALNPQLSPVNAALVALQTPGEIVGTSAMWRRSGYKVAKGERAAGRLTGRNFWPTAYFTAEQARAGDLDGFEPELPDAERMALMRAQLVVYLDADVKPSEAAEAVAAGLRGEPLPEVKRRPKRPEKTPQERLEDVAKRRARIERERARVDREIAALVRDAQADPDITVSAIARELGLSRQRLYQVAEAVA